MAKKKYDLPTKTFPYKIPKRLNLMSVPRKYVYVTQEGMPSYTPQGIRASALNGQANDRIADIAWPYTRRLVLTKRMYKNKFSQDRMERVDRMMEAANATIYAKLANCVLDLKTKEKDVKSKKKGWSESEWKKHMDYIGAIADPKKVFEPEPIKRGERKPLEALMPRIKQIAYLPSFKIYKRLSKETWYRNPEKVAPGALKYVISPRVRKLAEHRIIQMDM